MCLLLAPPRPVWPGGLTLPGQSNISLLMAPNQPKYPDDDLQKYYFDFSEKKAVKYRLQAAADAELAADLLRNPRYDGFFAPFRQSVREQFVRNYVYQRPRWVEEGDFYAGHLARTGRQFEAEAYERLWDIQQKKLFDLQCQWRAELVEVPGVRFSGDFVTLSAHIENSTAVPPITPGELDIYLAWVAQADYGQHLYDSLCKRFSWQDYDDIKMCLNEDDEEPPIRIIMDGPPEWYDFHNQRTGSGCFLRLPNLRGAKEMRYGLANRDANEVRVAALHAHTPPPPPDPRPMILGLEADHALQTSFVQAFEPKELRRQREAYQAAHPEKSWEDEDVESALDFLRGQDEPVPVPASHDWRTAVRQAMYNFRQAKLLHLLPQVYEAYCQRRAMGITQPSYSDAPRREVPDYSVNGLLDGRERLGEPRDFDF